MKAAKKRNVYSSEFKAKVGLEALRGMKTINQIGQEYGVGPKLTHLRYKKLRLKRNEMKGLEQLSMPNSPTPGHFHLGGLS